MIRVLIADDQRLMREGLRTLLQLEEQLEIVGTAADGEEALALCGELQPDVVLMDIRMPRMDGVEGTRHIRKQYPNCKVLVLTTFSDRELIFAALQEGASGYLLKDMPSESIASAIRTVHAGGVVLQEGVTGQLMAELKRVQSDASAEASEEEHRLRQVKGLTERELEVLAELGRGRNNREIAEELYLSEGTVKNHVSSIIAKLELRDRTQAAVFAVRNRITPE